MVQIERRRLMEELKKLTGELEMEEEQSIALKKKLGETENEVYTLRELCSNDKDLLKMLKSSN